jgi:hypothetical protein
VHRGGNGPIPLTESQWILNLHPFGEYVQDIKNRAQGLDPVDQVDSLLDGLPAFFRAAVNKIGPGLKKIWIYQ